MLSLAKKTSKKLSTRQLKSLTQLIVNHANVLRAIAVSGVIDD